jgi:hypothetical protein
MGAMKSKFNSTCRIFLISAFVCAVSFGTASAQPGGRLVILRSPNFGWDLAFNLQIDGRSVGSFAQGHQYDAWVPAGHHVLTVRKVPYAALSEPTSTAVNIQPGTTNVFTAAWDSNVVYLRPSGVWLTPGEIWQLRPPH